MYGRDALFGMTGYAEQHMGSLVDLRYHYYSGVDCESIRFHTLCLLTFDTDSVSVLLVVVHPEWLAVLIYVDDVRLESGQIHNVVSGESLEIARGTSGLVRGLVLLISPVHVL